MRQAHARTSQSESTQSRVCRLKFVRYADDFILGFIGTKAEAQAILDAIETFLETELHFHMGESKSKITHAKTEHAVFLGYDISVYGNVSHYLSKRKDTGVKVRNANGRVRLGVPYGLPHEKAKQYQAKGKPQARYELEELPVAEIIECYQREFRGLVNYYQYAVDVCQLSTLKYVMEQSLVKTLARKLQISVSKVCERYKTTVEVDGRPYKVLEERVEGEQKTYVFRWGGIPLRRRNILDIPLVDETVKPWIGRTDLITRLVANTCEVCGRTGKCESHHVRTLKDVQRKWRGRKAKPKWVIQMMSLRRKTLIVCPECHRAIHQETGRLKPKPDVVES